MPSNRVKESFENRIWLMDAQQKNAFFGQNHFTENTFYHAIQNAEVYFTKSKRHGKHKIYVLQIANKKGRKIPLLAKCTDESFIIDFIPYRNNWKRYLRQKVKAKFGCIIRLPKQKNLFYIPEERALQNQFGALQINNGTPLNALLKKSTFDYLLSDLKATPKPLHVFRMHLPQAPGAVFLTYCVWYKDKAKIVALRSQTSNEPR